mmetsp:Transcript_36257/g.71835  ORF Transcript_36257/g.71835 Transcript_36257/m.71835 type:complete len:223 (-) Transcript_36257:56-724(-)
MTSGLLVVVNLRAVVVEVEPHDEEARGWAVNHFRPLKHHTGHVCQAARGLERRTAAAALAAVSLSFDMRRCLRWIDKRVVESVLSQAVGTLEYSVTLATPATDTTTTAAAAAAAPPERVCDGKRVEHDPFKPPGKQVRGAVAQNRRGQHPAFVLGTFAVPVITLIGPTRLVRHKHAPAVGVHDIFPVVENWLARSNDAPPNPLTAGGTFGGWKLGWEPRGGR